jgi:hypothetical protein
MLYSQASSGHSWSVAPSGTAGAPITFSQAMTLTQGGNLLVGTTVDSDYRATFSGTPTIGGVTSNAILLRNAGFGGSNIAAVNQNNLVLTQIDFTSEDVGVNTFDDGVIRFSTRQDAVAGGALTERARITSGGYFKASNTGTYPIEAITGNNAAGAGHQFNSNENSSTVLVNNGNTGAAVVNTNSFLAVGSTGRHYQGVTNGTTVYQVLANGNVQNTNNSYGAISDIKLKENITDATPKLENLNRLRVVNYNLKADESKLKQIGLIAQEVEAIFPGLVETTPDINLDTKEPNGEVTKAVKYSVLVPMLLKAVQELSAQNAALTDRIAALESLNKPQE